MMCGHSLGLFFHSRGLSSAASSVRMIDRSSVKPVLLWVLFLASLAAAAPAQAGSRVALVLSAETYSSFKKSEIGIKRGQEIAEALKARGFEVMTAANPTNSEARAALRDFSTKVKGADLALAILIGHGTASSGQTFYLPTNVNIERSTDLLSRGLSITNIAQIAGHANVGAVCFLLTTPNFAVAINGLDARPQFEGELGKTATVVFSSSVKVPVSGIDAASQLAAQNVANLLQQPQATLRQLTKACANGESGSTFGTAADIELTAPAASEMATGGEDPVMATKRLEIEKAASEAAEKRMKETQVKTEQAQAEAMKSQATAEKAIAAAREAEQRAARAEATAKEQEVKSAAAAKALEAKAATVKEQEASAAAASKEQETKAATANAAIAAAKEQQAKAAAEIAAAKAEANKVIAAAASPVLPAAPPVAVAAVAPAAPGPDAVSTLVTLEQLLGPDKVIRIQIKLQRMALYAGPIDAIIGPLTRGAIQAFQKLQGDPVTGYLTPAQLQLLTSGG